MSENTKEQFLIIDQEFLDDWYGKVIQNRPDTNIYKEGLIAAYEDLCTRIGCHNSRIDSTEVKIRMRKLTMPAEPKAAQAALMPALVEARDALAKICSCEGVDDFETLRVINSTPQRDTACDVLARINAIIGDKK